jgi:hypothetical protein
MGLFAAKRLLLTIILGVLTAPALYAQVKLPIDPATRMVSYTYSIETDKPIKKQALYQLVQDWLAQTQLFNKANNTAVVKVTDKNSIENKAAAEKEFANPTPLQFVDPESDRLSGKGILRYNGQQGGCIKLFYVQYAVIVIVEDNKLTCQISHFKYNHFHNRNYQPLPVYNWSGNMPCDQVNTLEYLTECESNPTEFSTFYTYINAHAEELNQSLRDFIRTGKAVATNAN